MLALPRGAGVEPRLVDDLQEPLTQTQLASLLLAMGLGAHGLLRSQDAVYETLDLGGPVAHQTFFRTEFVERLRWLAAALLTLLHWRLSPLWVVLGCAVASAFWAWG